MKKSFCQLFRPVFLLSVLVFGLISCTQRTDAGWNLMEKVKDNNPRIAGFSEVVTARPYEGLTIVESNLLMQDSTENHLFIVEVDMESGLSLRPSSPQDMPYSKKIGLQDMLGQAQAAEDNGHKVLLAINADVFGFYEGLDFLSPRGVMYVDGEDISTSRGDDNVFYVKKDGSVHLDIYSDFQQVEGEVQQAIGVWQRLVWDGEVYSSEDYSEKNLREVNPRTFIGLSEDNQKVYFFVVDGRQPGYSRGFLMEDMVRACMAAGCDRACNLDGGGSTTLVLRDEQEGQVGFKLLNVPSDLVAGNNTPRKVANGLLVVEK